MKSLIYTAFKLFIRHFSSSYSSIRIVEFYDSGGLKKKLTVFTLNRQLYADKKKVRDINNIIFNFNPVFIL